MRIKDDEWNVYRRYSQFFEMHKSVRRILCIFIDNDGVLTDVSKLAINSQGNARGTGHFNFPLLSVKRPLKKNYYLLFYL